MKPAFGSLVGVAFFTLSLPLSGQNDSHRYALILNDAPLAARISSRKELKASANRQIAARIGSAQNSVRRQLAQQGIRVNGAVNTLLNAVFVTASQEQASQLRYLQGVRAVVPMPRARHHLNRALDLVKAPQAWDVLGGASNAGAGVKIAILDTGIDQAHAAFQDGSLAVPEGFPKCDADKGECDFTNNKIIAARSYVDMLSTVSRQEDDLSPRDRVGLGTAEAMIAAGVENQGPSATITGVAPKAFLGNYKIFGSPGVHDGTYFDVILKALEDAFDDGMDIALVPWGWPALYGPLDLNEGGRCDVNGPSDEVCDVPAQAIENAVSKGMVVVVSAGNDGGKGVNVPTLNTVETPGTAPSAITVGASNNAHFWFSPVAATASDAPDGLKDIPGRFGDGPKPEEALEAPLRDVAPLDGYGDGCTALPAGSLSGAIALIQRGYCSFFTKVDNARTAGAIAVILYREDGAEFPFAPSGLVGSGVPTVMIGATDGRNLQLWANYNHDTPVRLDPALQEWNNDYSDMVVDYSSRGPTVGDWNIKPELVAVGDNMYTATQSYDTNSSYYDATGYTSMDGTSFAAPMVAGAVALVKGRHADFTAPQLKSAVVNTASAGMLDLDGNPAAVTVVGAGLLNVEAAVRTTVTVEPATASFGVITQGALPMARTFRITNTSGSAVQLNIGIAARTENPLLSVSTGTLSLEAGQSDSIEIRLDGSFPAAGSYDGAITIQGGGADLRIPYLYVAPDGVPANMFPVTGDFSGQVNETGPCTHRIAFRLVDQFGIGVANAPVVFGATYGGGTIEAADATTDAYGMAGARVCLGPTEGDQEFGALAGDLTLYFYGTAIP